MRKSLIILSIFISLYSCKKENKNIEKENFELNVIAKNFPDSTKVYLYNRDIDKNIDSAYVINEKFTFSGKVDLPSLSYLNFWNKENKPIEPYIFFSWKTPKSI